MSAKQKILQGRGPFNIFVGSFDACRASQPVSSINYTLTYPKVEHIFFCLDYRLAKRVSIPQRNVFKLLTAHQNNVMVFAI